MDSEPKPQAEPGDQLGPYQIEALLGAGGMGQVFRARDTRLHRTVAIKVLPPERIADPERKRRFLQEARAASALNHPNIVTLYDISSDGGADFLVMEYVPGQPLDRLISPQGLPLADAVSYAVQIAGALGAAHAAGIVHRDIKPGNAIVTADAQVKVLDFGLAKLVERTPSGAGADTLTREEPLTEIGALLGTVAYMSPEQASARVLDHRTDIFSLGVVLYEMLAGRRPFQGKSPVETMHAILNDPAPPLPQYPPEIEEILAKALAKDPKDRYQHAGDLGLDLRRFAHAWETKTLLSMRPARGTVATARRRPGLWAAAILLGVMSGAIGWWSRGSTIPPENPLAGAKFTRFTDFEGAEHDAAISPDGRFVAFISDRDGPFDIWVSQVGTGRFTNLTQGKEPNLDSALRTLGFSENGAEIWVHDAGPLNPLRLVPLMGGAPRIFLGKGPVKTPPVEAAWSPDSARLVYHTSDPGDPMFVADRTGANPRQIFIDPNPGMHNHSPAWSQDGQWIYFCHGSPSAAEMDVWRLRASGGQPERLTHHNNQVGYPAPIDPRTVIYVARDQDGSGPWLWALDVERKVTRRASFGLEQYTSVAASADGRRLVATVANPGASLWSVPILDSLAEERDVKRFPLPTVRALAPRFGGPAIFYLSSHGAGDGLWRYQDGQALEIWKGADGALLGPPAVSSERRVAFVLRKNGKLRLHALTADGADLQPLADTIDARGAASWSPDAKWIVTGGADAQGPGLFKIPVEGGAPTRLVAGPALNPVWSPDGSLIVYAGTNVSLDAPLLAVRPDGTRVELPAITVRREGERARFLPTGKGLVYMQGILSTQNFWLLDLATKKTRPLTRLSNPAAMLTFDITPDGKQIVFDRRRENSDIVLIDIR